MNNQSEIIHFSDSPIEDLRRYQYVFILGQLLHGGGAAPLVILGTVLLDDFFHQESASIYVSIFQTGFILGPAIGFILGGQLLTLDVDLVHPLKTESTRWIGAWWPGFIIISFIATLIGLTLLILCRSIKTDSEAPGAKEIRYTCLQWTKLKCIFSNHTFVLVSLMAAVDYMILTGVKAFSPKYLEVK